MSRFFLFVHKEKALSMKTETYLAASGVGLAARGCQGDRVAAVLEHALVADAGD